MDEVRRAADNSTVSIGWVSCSVSTLVVKIPPLANLQNILGQNASKTSVTDFSAKRFSDIVIPIARILKNKK